MLTREQVIAKFKEVHGDKYDYTDTYFEKVTDKATFICPIHGKFEQVVRQHYRGQGCPECAKEYRGSLRKYDTTIFTEKAKAIHDNKYDYSLVKYVDSLTKVKIVCPEHGEFIMRPDMHLNGQGCPKCANKAKGASVRLSTEDFIKKANEIHDNVYDYSLVDYKNNSTPVTIICPVHGKFNQVPYIHLNGSTCPECAKISRSIKSTMDTEEFILKAREVHHDKYDYSKTNYVNTHTLVDIICPNHGVFSQKPVNHLCGCGCSKCSANTSKPEVELYDYIVSLVGEDKIMKSDRTLLNGKELDIYVPSLTVAFEFDGLFWHNEIIKPGRNYHLDKTTACEEKGVHLIHIFEDEWLYKKEICKSRIANVLGCSETRIYARKCEIKEIDNKTSRGFCIDNHIQGAVNASVSLGLFYHDELVSVMTFGAFRKNLGRTVQDNEWELLRFCNKLNTTVIGGAGKLFSYFKKNYKPTHIISYADRRWSMGNLYEKLGFTFKNNTKPSYFYVINDTRKNRFGYRKDLLISKYGCPPEMSEHDFCLSQKWYRIYDCGTKLYEY